MVEDIRKEGPLRQGLGLDKANIEQTVTSDEGLTKRCEELTKSSPIMLFMKGSPEAPCCGFSGQIVALLDP